MAGFEGFGPQALPFFKALAFHQSKAWFDANRALYEDDVLQPLTALLDELSAAFARKQVPLKADGRRSIFRLNRDIRFSKDKSPYKTHAGAVLTRTGGKDDPGVLYLHISPEGCFLAGGFHMPAPDALRRIREAIRARPAKFRSVLSALAKGGLAFRPYGQLTRVPRGFEELKDGPLADAVRMKSFIVQEEVDDAVVASPRLVGAALDFADRAMPLLEFGWAALA
jgi:uncharacterized protein (TIGR02453 family)